MRLISTFITIIILMFSSYLLNELANVSLILYKGFIVIALILLFFYFKTLPKYKLYERMENEKVIKSDGKELAKTLQKVIQHSEQFEKVPEEPILLTLNEQHHYLSLAKNEPIYQVSSKTRELYDAKRMSLDEIEEGIIKNIREITNYSYAISNVNEGHYPKDMKEHYLVMKHNVFSKKIQEIFSSKFEKNGKSINFEQKARDLSQKLELWKRKYNDLVRLMNRKMKRESHTPNNLKKVLSNGIVFENLKIDDKEDSVESDLLFVGPKGVYSFDIKSFEEKGLNSVHISKDGVLRKVFSNGKEEIVEKIEKTNGISKFLNDKLKEQHGDSAPEIELKFAVVITNDSIMINNESDITVLRQSSILHFINKNLPILSKENQNQISSIIQEYRKPEKTYEIPNIHAELENILLESEFFKSLYRLRYNHIEKIAKLIIHNGEDVDNHLQKEVTHIYSKERGSED